MSFTFVNKFLRRTEILCLNNCFRHSALQNGTIRDVRSATTKVKVPSPPKRPLTAYMIFCKQNRHSLLKEDPSLKSTQQIKLLAAKWTDLSPEMKKPYEDVAREYTISYGEMHKIFYENLTEEQRLELSRMKEEKKASRKLLKLKRALRESDMPPRPPSAYVLFIQAASRKKDQSDIPPKTLKEIAAEWRALSEEEKKPFYDQAAKEKEQYEGKMKEWNKRLVDEGKPGLLESYKATKQILKGLSVDVKVPRTKEVEDEVLSPLNTKKL